MDSSFREKMEKQHKDLVQKINHVVFQSSFVGISIFSLLGIYTWNFVGLFCYMVLGLILGYLHGLSRREDLQNQKLLMDLFLAETQIVKTEHSESVKKEEEVVPEEKPVEIEKVENTQSAEQETVVQTFVEEKPVEAEKKAEETPKVVVKKRKKS